MLIMVGEQLGLSEMRIIGDDIDIKTERVPANLHAKLQLFQVPETDDMTSSVDAEGSD